MIYNKIKIIILFFNKVIIIHKKISKVFMTLLIKALELNKIIIIKQL